MCGLEDIVLCFISWILSGIGLIIQNYDAPIEALWLVYSLIQYIGFALFIANIIQYIIDQLVTDELSTVIYWHCEASPIQYFLFYLAKCFNTYKYMYINLIMFVLSGLAVSLVLVSHSLFKHKLENISPHETDS